MAFPQDPLAVKVELLLAGVWTDVTGDVYLRNPISITRGRPDEASRVDPATCKLTVNNRLGKYSPRNPRSPYFGVLGRNTRVRVSVTTPAGAVSERFTGEVSAWPSRWDLSGNDVWVSVTASGILRRLHQGAPPLKDALRRHIQAAGPLAYWPLTDGEDARHGSEVAGGGRPFRHVPDSSSNSRPPTYGSGEMAKWLDPVAAIPADSLSEVDAVVTPTDAAAGGWTVDFFRYGLGSSHDVLLWGGGNANGDLVRWDINLGSPLSPDVILWAVVFSDNSSQSNLALSTSNPGLFTEEPHHIRLTVAADASGGTDWRLYIDGALWGSGNEPGVAVQPLTRIRAGFSTTDPNGDTGPLHFGHVTYWADNAEPFTSDTYDALLGYQGEVAGHRLVRLCDEEGVPLRIFGDRDDTPAMGPQRPGQFLDLLRAAEAVDGGVLGESRDELGLTYHTRSSRYGSTQAAVELDYAAGHISEPFEPTEDDQKVVNDVTASRMDGGEVRVAAQSGPLSTLPPPDGIGVYDDSVTLNVAEDEQLEGQAAWRVHLGTVDEARYPQVRIDLAANPGLAEEAARLDGSEHVSISNPPDWLPPGPVRQILEGSTEVLGAFDWDMTFNAAPAAPWIVGTVAGEKVVADFEDDAYAVTVTDGGDAPWRRDDSAAYSGQWSLRSGDITDSQTSDAVVTVPAGADTMSFRYKVDSEEGFDFLRVLVDGVEVLAASGNVGWTAAEFDVTGASSVTFRYSKDQLVSSGADAAWIDLLVFYVADTAPDRPDRVDTDGCVLAADVTESDTTLLVTSTDGPTWTDDPAELPFDMTVGGEVVRATAVTSTVSDTFTRTVTGGWGASTSGHAWSVTGDSADYSVDGSAGHISLDAVTSSRYALLHGLQAADTDVRATVSTDAEAAGGAQWVAVLARVTGDLSDLGAAAESYAARLAFEPDQTVKLSIWKFTSSSKSGLSSTHQLPASHAAGKQFTVRLRTLGSTLQAKAWPAGTPEPDAWQVTVTDTDVAGPGGVGVWAGLSSANTNTLPVEVSVDDVATPATQAVTATRSINGLVKGHTAGAQVRLAHPAVIAL